MADELSGTSGNSAAPPNSDVSGAGGGASGEGSTPLSVANAEAPSSGWTSERLKINGSEAEYSREEILAAAQKQFASGDKFKEAARMRQEAEEILGSLKDTKAARKALASKMGPEKLREMAIEMLEEELQEQMLTPEQKKLRDAERENTKLKETLKEREEREANEKLDNEAKALTPQLDQEIAGAFENSFLDRNPFILKQVVQRRMEGLQQGIRIPFQTIVKQLEREMVGMAKALKKDPARLTEAFGEEVVAELRKFDTSKLKTAPNINNIKSGNSKVAAAPVQKEEETKSLTPEQFREKMEEIKERARRGE